MTVVFVIVFSLVMLFWLAHKMRNHMTTHDAFYTQVKFIQMYMADSTEKLFYGKNEEEAFELGQDMLWSAASDFNARMDRAVNQKEPISMDDVQLLLSSIKIIKAAESMVYIKKNGPINYEIPEDSTAE